MCRWSWKPCLMESQTFVLSVQEVPLTEGVQQWLGIHSIQILWLLGQKEETFALWTWRTAIETYLYKGYLLKKYLLCVPILSRICIRDRLIRNNSILLTFLCQRLTLPCLSPLTVHCSIIVCCRHLFILKFFLFHIQTIYRLQKFNTSLLSCEFCFLLCKLKLWWGPKFSWTETIWNYIISDLCNVISQKKLIRCKQFQPTVPFN